MAKVRTEMMIPESVVISAVEKVLARNSNIDGGTPQSSQTPKSTTPAVIDGGTP